MKIRAKFRIKANTKGIEKLKKYKTTVLRFVYKLDALCFFPHDMNHE